MKFYGDFLIYQPGNLKFSLPHILFVDMSGDLNDSSYLSQQLEELERNLMMKNIKPSEVQKFCHICDVVTDGKFCATCGKWFVFVFFN